MLRLTVGELGVDVVSGVIDIRVPSASTCEVACGAMADDVLTAVHADGSLYLGGKAGPFAGYWKALAVSEHAGQRLVRLAKSEPSTGGPPLG